VRGMNKVLACVLLFSAFSFSCLYNRVVALVWKGETSSTAMNGGCLAIQNGNCVVLNRNEFQTIQASAQRHKIQLSQVGCISEINANISTRVDFVYLNIPDSSQASGISVSYTIPENMADVIRVTVDEGILRVTLLENKNIRWAKDNLVQVTIAAPTLPISLTAKGCAQVFVSSGTKPVKDKARGREQSAEATLAITAADVATINVFGVASDYSNIAISARDAARVRMPDVQCIEGNVTIEAHDAAKIDMHYIQRVDGDIAIKASQAAHVSAPALKRVTNADIIASGTASVNLFGLEYISGGMRIVAQEVARVIVANVMRVAQKLNVTAKDAAYVDLASLRYDLGDANVILKQSDAGRIVAPKPRIGRDVGR
jgi:hypothetical protein